MLRNRFCSSIQLTFRASGLAAVLRVLLCCDCDAILQFCVAVCRPFFAAASISDRFVKVQSYVRSVDLPTYNTARIQAAIARIRSIVFANALKIFKMCTKVSIARSLFANLVSQLQFLIIYSAAGKFCWYKTNGNKILLPLSFCDLLRSWSVRQLAMPRESQGNG